MDSSRQEAPRPRLERHPTLFLVYTVHLDTQWRWTIRETIADFLPATLEGNFELFERYPSRVLSFEGAFRYRLVEEYYPKAFDRLREAVANGNWRPAGAMLDAPDVNCVAPESLLRHILYAQRYFEKTFGTTSCDLFLPDCFGFGHALPTIAAHCGLIGFSAQKFGNWGAPAELPFDIGRWLGPDGSGLVAALRPEGYGEGLHEDLSEAERWLERIDEQYESSRLRVAMMYVGVGDRGGHLDDESLEWLEKSVEGVGPLNVLQVASDELFRRLTPAQHERLPRHQGELLLPTHGTGCWTSQAVTKRWNRRCERLADTAERAATIAHWFGVMDYPEVQLREAWQRFLWHQMHDDVTGTSIPEAYRFTWNDQLIAQNAFETVAADALGALARNIDTSGEGRAVVLFNPLEKPRCDPVEIDLEWPGAPLAIEAVGPQNEVVPVQVLERQMDHVRAVFAPPLPSLGMASWRLRPATDNDPESDLAVDRHAFTNERFRLTWNESGDVASLIDRHSGRELLADTLRLELLPDRSARWPAWEILHEDVIATPHPVDGKAEWSVVESGPVRAVLETRRKRAGSTFVQRVILCAGLAGHRVEFELDIDWRSRGRLLKAAFPLTCASPTATYGLACGTIERGNNERAKYEVPAESWAALADQRGAVAILTDGNYGWDKPNDATLRLSLLRSPRVLRKFRHQGDQDLGEHQLRFAIYSEADWDAAAAIEETARRFSNPPLAFATTAHAGDFGRSRSFLDVERGAVVRALKKAEDRDEIVLRLQEAGGRSRSVVNFSFSNKVQRARLLDGRERSLAELDSGDRVNVELRPFELKTLGLGIEPPPRPLYREDTVPLELPWDTRASSLQDEPVPFDGDGSSFPAELWPSAVRCGALPFEFGPADGENAVACRGQALSWDRSAEAVYLAASVTGPLRRTVFWAGDRRRALEIDRWDGLLGCWKGWRRGMNGLRWAKPGGGFVRRHRLAWLSTHRHDAEGKDLVYDFGYIFRYRIDLDPADTQLTLPESPDVKIFAATLLAST